MNKTRAPLTGANGNHVTNGIPHGSTSLTPFLAITKAGAAVEFYRLVFGARIVDVMDINGLVIHAELDFGNGKLQIGEPNPDYGLISAPEGEEACYSIAMYCPDVDVVVERAQAAGAVVREPVTTFVSGDRFGSIRDPFGVRWTILTRVEDLSEAESADRVAQWAAEGMSAETAG